MNLKVRLTLGQLNSLKRDFGIGVGFGYDKRALPLFSHIEALEEDITELRMYATHAGSCTHNYNHDKTTCDCGLTNLLRCIDSADRPEEEPR